MKKKTILLLTVLCFTITAVVCAAAVADFLVEKNEKENSLSSSTKSAYDQEPDARQERIAELEKEKQQVAEDAKLNPDKYASDDSNISFDEINKKRDEAIEDAKFWVKQYNSALDLVRYKNPAMGQPDIDSLEDVDVEILAALVDTLKKCPLSTAEEECLKGCLREDCLIVNETDPLYDEIMKILG